MLSNLVIGSEKVVLFVGELSECTEHNLQHNFRMLERNSWPNLCVAITDHNSYEPYANELLQSIARASPIVCYPKSGDIPLIESNFKATIEQEILATTDKPNVLLAPVSKLELGNTVPDIVNLVHYLKQNPKIKQIFIWCSWKNIRDDKIIPFLRYMSNIVVVLKNESEASILTKRNTGSVTRKVSIGIALNSEQFHEIERLILSTGISVFDLKLRNIGSWKSEKVWRKRQYHTGHQSRVIVHIQDYGGRQWRTSVAGCS